MRRNLDEAVNSSFNPLKMVQLSKTQNSTCRSFRNDLQLLPSKLFNFLNYNKEMFLSDVQKHTEQFCLLSDQLTKGSRVLQIISKAAFYRHRATHPFSQAVVSLDASR